MTIRPAQPYDCERLAALTTQLDYPASAKDIECRLERLDGVTLVAEVGGAILGWIHVTVVQSLVSDPLPEIHGLVVDEAHRGLGIGSQLIGVALEWSRQGGFRRVRVRTNTVRTATHRFYERLGFQLVKQQRVYERALYEGAEGTLEVLHDRPSTARKVSGVL